MRLGPVFSTLKIFSWVLLVICAALLSFGLYGLYDVMHPPRIVPPGRTLMKARIAHQTVDLLTEDGVHLAAWYTPPKNGTVILLAHGYGDNRPEWMYALIAKMDYGVLAWDARAHGESGGTVSTLGYKEVLDVKAALDFALAQPGVEHIGAWGGSMGGATMIRAAAQFSQIEALVVDSSFASLDDEVDFLDPYPILNPLGKLMMTLGLGVNLEKVSPSAVIGQISPRPVYIIQGTADTVAPPESAEILFNVANEPKYLWIEEGAIHLGVHEENPARYQRRVMRFFDEWLLQAN